MNIISHHISALAPTAVAYRLFGLKFKKQKLRRDTRRPSQNSACRLLLLVSRLAYSPTLKMETICFSETLGCLLTTCHCDPQSIDVALRASRRTVTSAEYDIPCTISYRFVRGVPEADPELWATVPSLGGAHCADQPL
jgi:hypothetical protein